MTYGQAEDAWIHFRVDNTQNPLVKTQIDGKHPHRAHDLRRPCLWGKPPDTLSPHAKWLADPREAEQRLHHPGPKGLNLKRPRVERFLPLKCSCWLTFRPPRGRSTNNGDRERDQKESDQHVCLLP